MAARTEMSTALNLFALSQWSRGPYVRRACSLEPSGSRHAPDDLFDPSSQGEQITVTTGGRIELEAEWKPFRVQCHRKADPGHAGGARGMRVPGRCP